MSPSDTFKATCSDVKQSERMSFGMDLGFSGFFSIYLGVTLQTSFQWRKN